MSSGELFGRFGGACDRNFAEPFAAQVRDKILPSWTAIPLGLASAVTAQGRDVLVFSLRLLALMQSLGRRSRGKRPCQGAFATDGQQGLLARRPDRLLGSRRER